MSGPSKIAGLLCGMVLWGLAASASTPSTVHKTKAAVKPAPPVEQIQVAAAPTPVTPPPASPTPEHLPATPPKVTMSGGLLSITAENSTLGDVLSAVKSLTGAGLDVPQGANSERVVVRLGPGHSQEVLQQLFAGSKFDYIILGSNDATGAVQKIILTARGNSGATAVAGRNVPNGQAAAQRGTFQPPPPPDLDSGAVEDEVVQDEPPPPQEEVTPPGPGIQQGQIGPNGQPLPPDQQQQQPKTPEQLLQELQRMQQQQQQGGRPDRGNVPQPQ